MSDTVKKMVYVGDNPVLMQKIAEVREVGDGKVLAKFQSLSLPPFYTFGWHEFSKKDFKDAQG